MHRFCSLTCILVVVASGGHAAETPPPPPPTEQQFQVQTVHLHLLSDDPRVELQDDESDRTLCKTPCDVDLQIAPGASLKLAGQGILQSKAFALRPDDADVTLRVHASQRSTRTAGFIVLGAGGTTMFGALYWWVANSFSSSFRSDDVRSASPAHSSLTRRLSDSGSYSAEGPRIAFGIGAGVAVLGAILLLNSPATSFSRE